jgi:hypothetical protein
VSLIRDNAENRAAVRVQSLCRKYLCRVGADFVALMCVVAVIALKQSVKSVRGMRLMCDMLRCYLLCARADFHLQDKIAEKREEYIARLRQKWVDLHAQFRYSDASDPRAVTMDNKIYFKTHLDLNRYAALLRVLMYKLAKYLARKRTAMLSKAILRWRGGLTTFLESDIQSSHINDLAIDFDSTKAADQFVSVAYQRNKITMQHVMLHDLAADAVLTSPSRVLPLSLTDEVTSHDTITAMPLRLPDIPVLEDLPAVDPAFDQMMSFTHLSKPNSPAAGLHSRNGLRSASSKSGAFSPPMSPSIRPLTGTLRPAPLAASVTIPTADNSYLLGQDSAVSAGTPLTSGRYGAQSGALTPASAAVRMDLTLDTSVFSVKSGFLNESGMGGQDQFPSFASSYVDPSGKAGTGTISNASASAFPITHDIVPSYYPGQDIPSLPPLPSIYIPRTAAERLHVKNERRLDYANFGALMTGPTYDSSWVIPDTLCMGSMPWGAAEASNTEYPVFDDAPIFGALSSTKSGKFGMLSASVKANSKSTSLLMTSASTKSMNASTGISDAVLTAKNRFKHDRWKPPPVTSVSALLLNKVDVFVSLLDEAEEQAIEQACRVPSVQSCIQNALTTANAAVSSIISQATEVISRQTKQMDDIPRYGKSDPRYDAAYRETLRCKARIQLAQDNIAKARKQIKDLPSHADFVRIPLRIDGLNTVNEILPKIWQIEGMLQQNRRVYVYSRDGHGRAGLVTAILLGRLYNLHPYEALYRVQASHDSAKRDAKREIPINCPQLPVQRELVAQVLHLANRPQELAFVRTQVDPETYVEHLPQRPLLHDPTVRTGYAHSADGSVASGGVYRPPHAHPKGVTMVHGPALPAHETFGSLSEHSSVVSGQSGHHSGTGAHGKHGHKGIHGGLSWSTYQEMEAAAAEEAAERAKNENLGNNLDVQQAESEFLEALFAAQNIRKKQTLGIGRDAAYTWGRDSGITRRSGPVAHTLSRAELPPEPLLPDLYERGTLGQSVDVARKLPIKRPEPTERPHLPHIRTALTPAPSVPLHHSSTYHPL